MASQAESASRKRSRREFLRQHNLSDAAKEVQHAQKLPGEFGLYVRDLLMPEDDESGCIKDVRSAGLASLLRGKVSRKELEPFSREALETAFKFKGKPGAPKRPRVAARPRGKVAPLPRKLKPTSKPKPPTKAPPRKKYSDEELARVKLTPAEEKAIVKQILDRFLNLLIAIKWPKWKWNDGNPFTCHITRKNCRKLGVPNYFNVIHKAMDLTIMQKKVSNGNYRTLETFCDDIDLMLSNARTYNPVGHDVHTMANQMEKRWKETYLPQLEVVWSNRFDIAKQRRLDQLLR